MKKYTAAIFVLVFLFSTPQVYGDTLLRWLLKHEVKAEAQDIMDMLLTKETQKDIEKKYKEYKKEQKRQKKQQEKKLKRIEKEKKRQEEEKFNQKKEEAQKLNEEENYEFLKYNEPQGSRELDFFGIYGKRQINSEGVVSPDFSKMVYSETHFYPSIAQLSTELFAIPLPDAQTPVERVMTSDTANKKTLKFYRPGMNEVEPGFFRTMTMVDWSSDSTKILAKERIAENLKGFLETRVWVYDFDTQKAYYLENLRKNFENYWLREGIDITKYRWDINPMGWYEISGNPSNQLIVNAYGYKPDKTRVFLGSWLVDYMTGETEFITWPDSYKPSQNGMVLRPKKHSI